VQNPPRDRGQDLASPPAARRVPLRGTGVIE
jgi:hypothetical protein